MAHLRPSLNVRMLAVVTAMAVSPALGASTVESAVHEFFAAVATDEESALDAVIADLPLDDRAWEEVQALISGYNCLAIVVRALDVVTATPDSAEARVTIDFRAQKGLRRLEESRSSVWILHAVRRPDGSWRIRRAETAEASLARRLVTAAEERDAILSEHRNVEWARVARLMSRHAHLGRGTWEILQYALRLSRMAADRALEVQVLGDLSLARSLERKHDDALALARQAVQLARETNDPDAICGALFTLGMRQLAAGRPGDALADLVEAGQMAEQIADTRIALQSLIVASYIAGQQRDARLQLELAERLAELSARSRYKEGQLQAALRLGDLHYALQNDDVAVAYFRTARALADQMRHRRLSYVVLCNLGACELRMGNVANAREVLEAAIRLSRGVVADESRTTMTLKLAHALAREGRLVEAQDRAAEALAIARKSLVQTYAPAAEALLGLAEIRLLRGDPAHALDLADTSRAEARLAGEAFAQSLTAPVETLRGRALAAIGRMGEAEAAFRAAIAASEALRASSAADAPGRARDFAEVMAPYVELADLLVTRGRAAEACAVAGQANARVMLDTLGEPPSPRQMSEDEQRKERELERRVASLNRAIASAPTRRQRETLEAQRVAARADLRRFLNETRIARGTPQAHRGAAAENGLPTLPERFRDALVVQYLVGEKRTIAFAVRPGANGKSIVDAHPIAISRVALERRIDALVARVGQRSLHYRTHARELYDLLVAPLADAMRGRESVVIVPDGALWRVPFQALVSPRERFLVEDAAVSYAPSISFLSEMESHPVAPARAGVLAFGNPATIERLPPLRDAEREVRAIARLYADGRTRVLVGAAAREEILKRDGASYAVLHFATHGVHDPHAPLHSALALAPSETADGDDGLLEAREVLRMRLGAELAVLSGCETARGRIDRGEGVIGLSWAFLIAGCRATVVSQWRAESEATATLMAEFYRQLRAGRTHADALRAAQRHLLRAGLTHPFYWAPFVLIGAGT